jgi:putative hemolysin
MDQIDTISYAQSTDPWLKRKVVNFVELATGREKITHIYEQLKDEPFQIPKFFSKGIQLSQLCLKYNQEMESNIPKEGPLVFVANHPFGIIDGLILCEIAARIRGDFRILLNNRLMKDEELNKLFLPVDFDGTPEATKKNVKTKKDAQQILENGGTVIIFPSGGVATRWKFGLGPLEELPWSTFAAKIIMKSKASVVPVNFEGENSAAFHMASSISESARLSLFIREVTRRMGTTIKFKIGNPIHFKEMEQLEGRKNLTEFLKKKVEELSSKSPRNKFLALPKFLKKSA